jgi:hypothetical protein
MCSLTSSIVENSNLTIMKTLNLIKTIGFLNSMRVGFQSRNPDFFNFMHAKFQLNPDFLIPCQVSFREPGALQGFPSKTTQQPLSLL